MNHKECVVCFANRNVETETPLIKARMKGCLVPTTIRPPPQYLFLLLSRSVTVNEVTFIVTMLFDLVTLLGFIRFIGRGPALTPTKPNPDHQPFLYHPASSKQSKTSDKNRHKKPKDVKPKVKKLKYHQYIPPDQKSEKSPPPMDSAYARLLQQQQLFLQLQILSQQKHAHAHPQTQQPSHTPQTQAQAQAQQRQPSFSYQPHPAAQTQK